MEFPEDDEWPGRWRFVTAIIALCWVLSMLSVLSLLILPLLGFALFRVFRRRAWHPLLWLLLANPLGVYFIAGMADYARGAPKLSSMGLPATEFYNIEPKTRCYRETGGCVIHGSEWASHAPHNLGVMTLATLLGPPSRSYDGPYPSKEQAARLSSSAPALAIADFLDGKIRVGGEVIEINREHIRTIMEDLRLFSLGYDDDAAPLLNQVRATVFEKRCLILRLIENDSRESSSTKNRDFIVLFDRNNMRPFAYYRISGDSATRRPRLQYLPELSR